MKFTKKWAVAAAAIVAFPVLGAASCNDNAQSAGQQTTEQYEAARQKAVPYPLAQMEAGGWTEARELSENLLRQNDPNAIHYVYWLTMNGGLIAQYTIKGMVFNPNSQLTNTQSITWSSNGGSGVVDAPGDNGTYGPEAFCYAFFTTAGSEKKLPCDGLVDESDTPEHFNTPPIITYDASQKSPLDKGQLKGIGGN